MSEPLKETLPLDPDDDAPTKGLLTIEVLLDDALRVVTNLPKWLALAALEEAHMILEPEMPDSTEEEEEE